MTETRMVDVEEVRAALLAIIDANPDARGRLRIGRESRCVYFFPPEWAGAPRNATGVWPADPSRPCCLIGRYVASVPGLLDDVELLTLMTKNESAELIFGEQPEPGRYVSAECTYDGVTFTAEAGLLLQAAQVLQDGLDDRSDDGVRFRDLREDIESWQAPEDEEDLG